MSTPLTIKGWVKGVDNIHAPYELPRDALRVGENIDILDSGKIRRRNGSTASVSAVGVHSLWSNEKVSDAYYVAGSTMYSLSDSLASAAVVTGLTPGARVAYVEVNGEILWSNGVVTGRLANGVNYPLGVETPAGVAQLAATTGALPAGRYQITTTFRTASGEEGGAQNAGAIVLSSAGGITMSNMPAAQSATVTHRCIYATLANGDVMYKIATIPSAGSSYTISNIGSQTVALRTMNTQPMPAGSILAFVNGVLYVAVGPIVYHSEPMRYGQCNLSKNYYAYPVDVDIMVTTPSGVFICADKTYFLENPGTSEVIQRTVFPFGGVKGTGVYLPGSTGAAWYSPRGQVTATGSQATLTSEKMFVPGVMTSGASMAREENGVKQIVNVANVGEANALEYTGA